MSHRHAVAITAAAAALLLGACGGGGSATKTPPSATSTRVATTAASNGAKVTAKVAVLDEAKTDEPVQLYDEHGAKTGQIAGKTYNGTPRVFEIVDTKDGWLQVLLPRRPNGSTAWIPATSVVVAASYSHIQINLTKRTITIHTGGKDYTSTKIAIGKKGTETPTGHGYVTDAILKPGGAYGAGAIGLSLRSTKLKEFDGNDGQVAIHGTNQPELLGKAVSHGCVRVEKKIAEVLPQVPVGTPVDISS